MMIKKYKCQNKWYLDTLMTTNPKTKKRLNVFIFCLQMLLEVGFMAGQHELLSESLHKENYKNVREQVKKLREVRRRNMDEHKKHLTELKQVYHAMEKSKEKFRKAFEDQVRSKILLIPYYQSLFYFHLIAG